VKSALGYAEHWHTDLQLSATPASLSHVEEKNNSTVSLTEEHSTEVCTPSAECELCPHGWRVSVERDDEKIKGEFEACEKYERRQKHDCTLFYDTGSTKKVTKNRSEYRPCQYTESDEQSRMMRLQLFCLILGILAYRTARRQRVASASLFDQRRLRGGQNNATNNSTTSEWNGSAGGGIKYSAVSRDDSMDAIELTGNTGTGKVPKSPAPNLHTV